MTPTPFRTSTRLSLVGRIALVMVPLEVFLVLLESEDVVVKITALPEVAAPATLSLSSLFSSALKLASP